MYCPKCSQPVSTDAKKFCSKCGFNLKGLKNLVENAGEANENINPNRRKGIRQGAKLILLSGVLFPAYVLLSALFPPDDKLVESSPSSTWFEQICLTILWTLFLAGAARILYALIFERNSAAVEHETPSQKQMQSKQAKGELPPEQSIPASEFGKWKTTDELFEPIFNKPKTSGELK